MNNIKLICKECKIEFLVPLKRRNQCFCSYACSMHNRFNNDEYKQKMRNIQAEVHNRKEWKEKQSIAHIASDNNADKRAAHSDYMKTYFLDEQHISRASERLKILWKNTAYRNKKINALINKWKNSDYRNHMTNISKKMWKNPEHKEHISKLIKQKWKNPDYRKKMINILIERWSDKDYVNKMSIIMKRICNSDEWKNNKSKVMINLWQKPGFAEHHMHACFKYKEYILPSGKMVKIQGYEPQVLTELLKTYLEDDIVIGVKEMNKEIGKIKYILDDNEHTYYPDFYIKSTNTIIEVKSQWTYNQWREKNELKKSACITAGFNFQFKIL